MLFPRTLPERNSCIHIFSDESLKHQVQVTKQPETIFMTSIPLSNRHAEVAAILCIKYSQWLEKSA